MWRLIRHFFTKKKEKTQADKFSSLELINTPVHDLVLGMYVAELDIDWLESPFMFQGFFIETEAGLKNMILDATGNALSIRAIINSFDYQIDTEKYYQQGVIQKGFSQRK